MDSEDGGRLGPVWSGQGIDRNKLVNPVAEIVDDANWLVKTLLLVLPLLLELLLLLQLAPLKFVAILASSII